MGSIARQLGHAYGTVVGVHALRRPLNGQGGEWGLSNVSHVKKLIPASMMLVVGSRVGLYRGPGHRMTG